MAERHRRDFNRHGVILESQDDDSPRSLLPNLVVVLTKGYFLFGEGNSSGLRNLEIKAIQDLKSLETQIVKVGVFMACIRR